MATPWADPRVQHSSHGDMARLDGALAMLRKQLSEFAKAVEALEHLPVQVTADIRIAVGGKPPEGYNHAVIIDSKSSDPESSASLSSSAAHQSTPLANNASSTPAKSVNGQQLASTQSPSRPRSQRTNEDVDISALRSFKRPKLDKSHPSSQPTPSESLEDQDPAQRAAEMYNFMKDWHTEWTAQGGWLFDNITKMNATIASNKPAAPAVPDIVHKTDILQRMDAVQDVLGQSINSVSASTMAELSHISTNLLPWLETCRKTSADKVQAREEKWRMSSANFHDQARRDREAAERRIERKLEEQAELLMRIARAGGIDVEALEGLDDENRHVAGREGSLGAQLTAELNMEASKARTTSRYDSNTRSVAIED